MLVALAAPGQNVPGRKMGYTLSPQQWSEGGVCVCARIGALLLSPEGWREHALVLERRCSWRSPGALELLLPCMLLEPFS